MVPETAEQKLNVGCGNDIRPGWVNLDGAALPGVDVVHDIEKLPWPFAESSFDHVLCQDVLEHTDYVALLQELHRIVRPGGTLKIRVPHFTSRNNFTDPTHKRLFSVSTFSFFVREASSGKARERQYYFDFHFARISERRLTFERSSQLFFYNRLVAPIVNASPRMQEFFEATMLSRLFPAENIVVT
ncbi:MAG: class I SAM-dependent methyltransferase, partial [Patescibacteria group bacterium]|nr:class I SAM-dependent methyltransferase [Patescibacteria group bacterium]